MDYSVQTYEILGPLFPKCSRDTKLVPDAVNNVAQETLKAREYKSTVSNLPTVTIFFTIGTWATTPFLWLFGVTRTSTALKWMGGTVVASIGTLAVAIALTQKSDRLIVQKEKAAIARFREAIAPFKGKEVLLWLEVTARLEAVQNVWQPTEMDRLKYESAQKLSEAGLLHDAGEPPKSEAGPTYHQNAFKLFEPLVKVWNEAFSSQQTNVRGIMSELGLSVREVETKSYVEFGLDRREVKSDRHNYIVCVSRQD